MGHVRMLSWVQKGGFAVLDQALFAGTNFLASVLLARWLESAQYGSFAVAYATFLLLSTIHTSIITEPMLVFGPGKYAKCFPQYLGLLIYGHWLVTGIISLILAATATILWQVGPDDLAQAIAGLIVASPLILLTWLLRRAFYVPGIPQWSATGGGLYLGLMLAGMYWFYREQWLSTTSAILIMGAASLLVSLWLATLLSPQWPRAGSPLTPRGVYADHWGYGRWALATAAVTWLPGSLSYMLLAAWEGLEGSAVLRAAMNLVMPILHANTAVAVLLLPYFVQAFTAGGRPQLRCLVRLVFMLFVLTSLGYWLFLFCFRAEVLGWAYGGRYTEATHVLLLAGMHPFPAGISAVLGGALRAMKRPDLIFWCQTFGAVVTIALGVWLIPVYGVSGAVLAGLSASMTASLATMWTYRRLTMALKDE
jgi:O-antigen/teichoic acid export membrane protein